MLLKRRLFRVCDKWIRNNPNIIEKFQEDNYMRMRKCDFKKVVSYFDDMNVLLRAVWIHNRAFVLKLQQKISMNKNLLGHSMWNGPNFKKLPTWPSWIFLKFCQVNVPIKKWKSWKFYCLLVNGSKIKAI